MLLGWIFYTLLFAKYIYEVGVWERWDYKNLCTIWETYFGFLMLFVFLCFKVLSPGVCVYVSLSAHLYGDEGNWENENRLKS